MRPSILLAEKRDEIIQAISRAHVHNPRVFGSVLDHIDSETSDLDLLVDAPPGTTLFDLGGLQEELEDLLGIRVDVLTPKDIPQKFRAEVLAHARPL